MILHQAAALTRIKLATTPGPEAAAQIERILDGQALLANGSTAVLLDAVLMLPSTHRLHWTLDAAAGSWRLRRSELSVDGGLGLGVELDRSTARLVAMLDGRRTLRELLVAEGDAGEDSRLDRVAQLIRAGLIGISRPR